MKICFVNPFDVWEATGRRLINMVSILHNNGHEVTFLATKREKEGLPQKIPFELIELPPRISLKKKELLPKVSFKRINYALSSFPKFLSLLGLDFDIVHASKTIPQALLPSIIAGRLKSKKVVLDWDDWEGRGGLAYSMPPIIREMHIFFEKWSFNKVDGISVTSKFLENYTKERGYKKPVTYLPNGIDLDSYKNVKKTKLPSNSVVIVGTLSSTSELPYILPSVAMALKKIDLNLIVVGEGERRSEFEGLTRKLGIEKNVRFLGWISEDQKNQVLHSSDVALMPMKDNIQNKARSPVKLPEYMALGCAIIANAVGEVNNVLNGAGLLINQSKESLANALVSLMEDKKLRNKLKQKAQERVKLFDWKVLMKDFEIFYDKVLHQK